MLLILIDQLSQRDVLLRPKSRDTLEQQPLRFVVEGFHLFVIVIIDRVIGARRLDAVVMLCSLQFECGM